MKKRIVKRIALGALGLFILLIVVLGVHIYIMTRPKAPDASTRGMARIDIKQPITQKDADKITTWLYGQDGVDRVMVNPNRDIVVFTFFPIRTNANLIVSDLKSDLGYKADRFVPTAAQINTGSCPAMSSNSITYKVYSFFKNHF